MRYLIRSDNTLRTLIVDVSYESGIIRTKIYKVGVPGFVGPSTFPIPYICISILPMYLPMVPWFPPIPETKHRTLECV